MSCTSLDTITVLGDLKSLGRNAFGYCSILCNFFYYGITQPSFENDVFLGTPLSAVIVTKEFPFKKFTTLPIYYLGDSFTLRCLKLLYTAQLRKPIKKYEMVYRNY